jgi:hypothetical protein
MRFDDRDEADFLTEEGQLKYNLSVEAEEFKVWGINMNVLMILVRMNNCTSTRKVSSTNPNYSRHPSKDTQLIPQTSL